MLPVGAPPRGRRRAHQELPARRPFRRSSREGPRSRQPPRRLASDPQARAPQEAGLPPEGAGRRKRVPRGAPSAPMSACAGGAGRAGMAFRQALQLAACGLAGGSAAVLFSAVAVGKPRAGGDAEPRVVEPPAWAGATRPGPGVWDPNWDRCGAGGWSRGALGRPGAGAPPWPRPCRALSEGRRGRFACGVPLRFLPRGWLDVGRRSRLPAAAPSSVPQGRCEAREQ